MALFLLFAILSQISSLTASHMDPDANEFMENLIWNQCVIGNVSFVKSVMTKYGSCVVLNGGSLKGPYPHKSEFVFWNSYMKDTTCFHTAARHAKTDLVKLLLKEGVDTAQKNGMGKNALHHLIIPHVPTSATSSSAATVMTNATHLPPVKTFKDLFDWKVDEENIDVVSRLLLDACVDVYNVPFGGVNLVTNAALAGFRDLLRSLLQRGVDFLTPAVDGIPPMLRVLLWQVHAVISDPLLIGTRVMGYLLVCFPICSLRCTHTFAQSLTQSPLSQMDL